jgi:hypothetical protein
MAGTPLILFPLTAREGRLSTEECPAARSSTPRCGHSGRRGAFVRPNYKTGAFFVVKTGASAVVLERR